MAIEFLTTYINKETGEIINPNNLQNIDPNVVSRLTETITEDPILKNTIINATTITPNTQTITGTVSISNLPSIQTVHIDNISSLLNGSIAISNFPATQTVNGTVSISNFPSSQTVHIDNFPTSQTINGSIAISNFPATQTVNGIVSIANFPNNQNVTITGLASKVLSGSISIDNFPATQPISVAALPLPTGAAQDGTDISGVFLSGNGSGIRGWLSGIYELLSNTINVNVTNQVSGQTTTSSSTTISNFPSTQTVNGTLSIANFPTNQQINGNVSILNLPNIQQISGSVNIGNLPAIQPVSGAVSISNFPTLQNVHIDSFPANQVVSGTIAISNFPSTQPISGSINIANFPAIQPVSLTVLPLPTGAAQDGTDIAGATLATGSGIRGWLSSISVKLADKINVNVLNFPSTQTVNGAVSISSGNINITNFPTSQTINGSVNIANFPATQPVSGSLNIANFPSTQTVHIDNFPATQPISGTIAISNFPATQVVSGSGNFVVTGSTSVGNPPVNNPVSISGVDAAGLKQHLRTDTFGTPSDAVWTSGNGNLISLLKANANALNNLININQPVQGIVTLTPGTTYAPGRGLRIICTTSGNITLNYVNGSSDTIPINAGLLTLDGAITSVVLPQTGAAVATFANYV